jgi:hypothetical protein
VAPAPIWLGPNADDCLVLGGQAATTVLDHSSGDTLIKNTQTVDPSLAAHSMKPRPSRSPAAPGCRKR